MRDWDGTFERECTALVAAVCNGESPRRERDSAWKRLLTDVGPHLEQWARNNALLRRCRLGAEDDTRSVLVLALGRLSRDDFANLRAFLVRRDLREEDERVATMERAALLAEGSDDAPAVAPPRHASPAEPGLRGWMINLVRFAAADHVESRLGAPHATAAGVHVSKRDLGTGAERLDAVPDLGARPPITDIVTLRALLCEISAYASTFPDEIRDAFAAWIDGAGFDEIAERQSLGGPERARALVRAAQARLRERFRERWPELPDLDAASRPEVRAPIE